MDRGTVFLSLYDRRHEDDRKGQRQTQTESSLAVSPFPKPEVVICRKVGTGVGSENDGTVTIQVGTGSRVLTGRHRVEKEGDVGVVIHGRG